MRQSPEHVGHAFLAKIGATAKLTTAEADASNGLGQEGASGVDTRPLGLVPAKVSLLHGILGFRHRAEHAVGEPGQIAPMVLELIGALVVERPGTAFACHSHGEHK
jgi:hypothetical protein